MPKASEILDGSFEEAQLEEAETAETEEEATPTEGEIAVEEKPEPEAEPSLVESDPEPAPVDEPERKIDEVEESEPQMTLEEIEAQRLRLSNERLRRDVERLQQGYESVSANRDKLSGAINSKLTRIEQRLGGVRESPSDSFDYAEEPARSSASISPEIEEMRAELARLKELSQRDSAKEAAQAIAAAGTEFMGLYKDLGEFEGPVADALQAQQTTLEKLRDEGRAAEARVLVMGTLQDAYFKAKDAKLAKLEEEARKRGASQAEKLKGRRQLATPAGVGTVRDSADGLPDDLSKMSLEQLEAEYKRLGRAGF